MRDPLARPPAHHDRNIFSILWEAISRPNGPHFDRSNSPADINAKSSRPLYVHYATGQRAVSMLNDDRQGHQA